MFTNVSYLELLHPFLQRSITICAILVEGIMRNNSVRLFEFGSVIQVEMTFKIVLSVALAALLLSEAEPVQKF